MEAEPFAAQPEPTASDAAATHAALTARPELTDFSGVIRVEIDGELVHESAHGFADRAHGVAHTPATRIGIASGAKGFTALAVMASVDRGVLTLDTTARSLLGTDLPLIGDDVTIEHLLGHRSGIGDYLDESAGGEITDYVMPIPVHRLSTPEEYLAVLDGYPSVFPAGQEFAYNNGGYVVLALLAERAAGTSYYELIDELVCRPAELHDTAFLRSDELPGNAAIGYLDDVGPRTNLLHLPVRGCGDGGIFTTARDVSLLWQAVAGGRIVRPETWERMITPHASPAGNTPYGLGFWLDTRHGAVQLEGYDAGASFRSVYWPSQRTTWSVLSNTSPGAWPAARAIHELIGPPRLPAG